MAAASCASFWDIPGMKAGVVTGDLAWSLLEHAKAKSYAIPAFNCTTTSSVNAVLEAGRALNRPVIVQFSEGGSAFFAGKSLANDVKQASILGAVVGAHYVRSVAPAYGIPVLVHSDHCAKKLLPWFDGMLKMDEAFFEQYGEPLFSSHMLDLSEEPHDENIAICAQYFKRMAPMKLILEMEIGITGGVEDGVDNSGVSKDKLYSTPDDVYQVYQALSPISPMFTIAAAFGNVHGVYKPGNVRLQPELLDSFQKFLEAKRGGGVQKPYFFVFHGGSGSEKRDIDNAVSFGVVKMNVDTDTQWAYWEGILRFYEDKEGYLQGQIGNPDGPDKPNKSYYDPRKWVRCAEESMVARVKESCADLKNVNSKTTMIFQLGTNNWQVEGGGFAPGSGILHEAHHTAYNKLPNTKSYSVWPLSSKYTHTPAPGRTDYRVFQLNHDIPICESVSPVSNYRWHSMSDEDFSAYRKRLADFVFSYMEDAEKESGENFTMIIAHHSFLNPLVGQDVLARRKAAGKPPCHLCVFVHGTALKMYVHEREGKNQAEYPMRFLPIIEKSNLFSAQAEVSRIFAISAQQVDAFKDVFPNFPNDRVTVSPNGINFDVFSVPNPPLTRDQVLAEVKHTPYEGEPVAIPAGYDEMIIFVGKFANWKRLDSVLMAASSYEKAFEAKGKKVCTIIGGSGPADAVKMYQDMALKDLGLRHCFFLGAQPQPMLAKLYSVASIGVFPSKAEPFGLVFVECMACKTPVIGADSGGPRDFVTPDVGILVNEPGGYTEDDNKALAKDLDATITKALDENWKATKGEACLKLARDRFGVENQVVQLIRSVVA